MTAALDISEYDAEDLTGLDELVATQKPFVVRGLINHWPLKKMGEGSFERLSEYLLSHSEARKMVTHIGNYSSAEHIGYNDSMEMNFRTEELDLNSGAPAQLSTFPCGQFNVVNHSTQGDVFQGEGVTNLNFSVRTVHDLITDLDTKGSEDITLLTIFVLNQTDTSIAVWIVFDGFDYTGYVKLVAFEIDYSVFLLMTAATMTHGDSTLVVATGFTLLGAQQRFFGGIGGDIRKIVQGHISTSGGCWIDFTSRHDLVLFDYP